MGGYECPNLLSISCKMQVLSALGKRARNSTSAADAVKSFKMAQVMYIYPLKEICCLLTGRLSR